MVPAASPKSRSMNGNLHLTPRNDGGTVRYGTGHGARGTGERAGGGWVRAYRRCACLRVSTTDPYAYDIIKRQLRLGGGGGVAFAKDFKTKSRKFRESRKRPNYIHRDIKLQEKNAKRPNMAFAEGMEHKPLTSLYTRQTQDDHDGNDDDKKDKKNKTKNGVHYTRTKCLLSSHAKNARKKKHKKKSG